MDHSMTLRSKKALGLLAIAVVCAGCPSGDLGTSVEHKPHALTGQKKGGGADMDLLPAPPGIKTGTAK